MMFSVGRLKLVEEIIAREVLSESVFNYTLSLDKTVINGRWPDGSIVGQIFFI